MTSTEACRLARRQMGSMTTFREECRDLRRSGASERGGATRGSGSSAARIARRSDAGPARSALPPLAVIFQV